MEKFNEVKNKSFELFKLNINKSYDVYKKLSKTKNIMLRGLKNNMGKIVIFLMLVSIMILLIYYEIPIDSSYKDDSEFGERVLSGINAIILAIILAGAVAIFSTETNITHDEENIKNKLNCKLDIIKDTFNLEYVYTSINNDKDDLNKLHNLYSTNNTKYTDNIKKKKIILLYLLGKLYNCNCESNIYLQAYLNLLKYIENLETNDYASIYGIEQYINKNFNKLNEFIKVEKNNLNKNIIKEYYTYSENENENENEKYKNKNLINLFLEKHNLNKDEIENLIDTIDIQFIENVFNMLKVQCSSTYNNCS